MQRLPEKEFLETFKNAPRVAINIIVKNEAGEILLAKRHIQPFINHWHMPGSFLLKNETIRECQKRIAESELGLEWEEGFEPTLLGAFDNIDGDPRGHVVDLVYGLDAGDAASKIKPTKETSELKFFAKLPEEIGFNQEVTLRKLKVGSA